MFGGSGGGTFATFPGAQTKGGYTQLGAQSPGSPGLMMGPGAGAAGAPARQTAVGGQYGLAGASPPCCPTGVDHLFCEPAGSVSSTDWKFVGQGRGSYEAAQTYAYVGEGVGSYTKQQTMATGGGGSTCCRAECVCLVCCALVAVLLGCGLLFGAFGDAPGPDAEHALGAGGNASTTAWPPTTTVTTVTSTMYTGTCSDVGRNCNVTRCCNDNGLDCYKKDEFWATCRASCTEGVDLVEDHNPEFQTPWSCDILGGDLTKGPLAGGIPRQPLPGEESEDVLNETGAPTVDAPTPPAVDVPAPPPDAQPDASNTDSTTDAVPDLIDDIIAGVTSSTTVDEARGVGGIAMDPAGAMVDGSGATSASAVVDAGEDTDGIIVDGTSVVADASKVSNGKVEHDVNTGLAQETAGDTPKSGSHHTSKAVEKAGKALVATRDHLDDSVEAVGDVHEAASHQANAAADAVKDLHEGAKHHAGKAADAVAGAAQDLHEGLKHHAGKAAKGAADAAAGVQEAAAGVAGDVHAAAKHHLSKAADATGDLHEAAKHHAGKAAGAVADAVGGLHEAAKGSLADLVVVSGTEGATTTQVADNAKRASGTDRDATQGTDAAKPHWEFDHGKWSYVKD